MSERTRCCGSGGGREAGAKSLVCCATPVAREPSYALSGLDFITAEFHSTTGPNGLIGRRYRAVDKRSAKAGWARSGSPSRANLSTQGGAEAHQDRYRFPGGAGPIRAGGQALAMMDHPILPRVLDGGHHAVRAAVLRDGAGQRTGAHEVLR